MLSILTTLIATPTPTPMSLLVAEALALMTASVRFCDTTWTPPFMPCSQGALPSSPVYCGARIALTIAPSSISALAVFFWMFSTKPAATATLPSLVCACWRPALLPMMLPALTLLDPLTPARPAPPETMLSAWLSALPEAVEPLLLPPAPSAPAMETLVTVLLESAPTYTPLAVTLLDRRASALSLTMVMSKLPPTAARPPFAVASAVTLCLASFLAYTTTVLRVSPSLLPIFFSSSTVPSARVTALPFPSASLPR